MIIEISQQIFQRIRIKRTFGDGEADGYVVVSVDGVDQLEQVEKCVVDDASRSSGLISPWQGQARQIAMFLLTDKLEKLIQRVNRHSGHV